MRVMAAFARGDLAEARQWQLLSVQMVSALKRYPFITAMKLAMAMQGVDCGRCRLPQGRLDAAQEEQLKRDLDALGFFDWAQPEVQNGESGS
jgi:N-acetylneuraminate lyase